MIVRACRSLALSVLSLVLAGPAFAQATGTVSGRIVDQTGAALPGVTIDLSGGKVERTSVTDAGGNYHIESVPSVISGGLTIEPARAAFGTVRVRHFGPRPLIENASVKSKATTLWNAEAGYNLSRRIRLVLEAYNLFDAEVSDIDYFYTSRLPGEPADGIDDLHTHSAIPRALRLALRIGF